MKRLTSTLVVAALAMAAPAFADNQTAASAHLLPADGSTQSHYVYGPTGPVLQRWYVTEVKAGRSYSWQVLPGGEDSTGANSLFVELSAFDSDGTTVLTGATSTGTFAP